MDIWIRIEDCRHGGVYEVEARNFEIAVYNADKRSFFGIRHKFGSTFLDSEEHWDCDAPHGTAKPIKFICMLPEDIQPIDFLNKIDSRTGEEVRFIDNDEKRWLYVNKNDEPVELKFVQHVSNKVLFDFLKKLSSKPI